MRKEARKRQQQQGIALLSPADGSSSNGGGNAGAALSGISTMQHNAPRRKRACRDCTTAAAGSKASGTAIADAQDQSTCAIDAETYRAQECMVCMTRSRDLAHPCGHMCACFQCATACSNRPVCPAGSCGCTSHDTRQGCKCGVSAPDSAYAPLQWHRLQCVQHMLKRWTSEANEGRSVAHTTCALTEALS